MYNQEIKERFLEEYLLKRNEKSCLAKLEAIGVYEYLVDKDLCRMSFEQCCEALRHVHIGTYGSAFNLVSLVRSYIKWCSVHFVYEDINNALVYISVDDIDISYSLKEDLFFDEDEFIRELRSVRTFDEGYYDVIAMIFSWLGLGMDQLMAVKIHEVDFDNHTVLSDGRSYEFSEKLSEILALYAKTKKSTRQNYSGLREVYRDDSFDTFIRKFCAPKQLGKKLTKSQLWNAIHDLNENYVSLGNLPRFTLSNVAYSGALYRLRQLELSGVDVFSKKNKDAVSNVFAVDSKLHEILWLYNNYKRALSL